MKNNIEKKLINETPNTPVPEVQKSLLGRVPAEPPVDITQGIIPAYPAPTVLTAKNFPTVTDLQETLENGDKSEAKELAAVLKAHVGQQTVRFCKDYLDKIGEVAVQCPSALKLLMFFIKYMNSENALAVPDNTLQELLDYSKPTIDKAVKYLEENGLVVVWKKKGEPNVYVINKNVASR